MKSSKNIRKKRFKVWYLIWILLGPALAALLILMRFGGFTTGESADPEEFEEYAQSIESIQIPEHAKIIALGEAAHGNIEFQQLKLHVFQQMVDNYNVKAFVLESDYGGSEQVNRYIHGGGGTAEEAAAALGFAIYRTEEMEKLISYMRQYNESAAEGEDLRFYGCDMQRIMYSFQFLIEACNETGVDTTLLQRLADGENWNSEYDSLARTEIIIQVKKDLADKENSAQAIHCADMLLQYDEFHALTETDGGMLRDKFMAENVKWILGQEQQLGRERIFVSGHNSHVAKWGSLDSMGKLLSNDSTNGYYAIGTDFYKTKCNLPIRSSAARTNQVFYSHDPLAKAAKTAGFKRCWLDFARIPDDTGLAKLISQYNYMGTLGERYSLLMRILPPSYRIFQPPAVLYDSMIFVTDANPTKIKSN